MAQTVDQRLASKLQGPPEYKLKVDIQKVNMGVIKTWIAGRINEILGDDEVVVETCFNLLEQQQHPNIRSIHVALSGFLDKDTAAFCKELWILLLSAQDNPNGVPQAMVDAKKLEIAKQQAAEALRNQNPEQDEMIDSFREEERTQRRPDRGEIDRERETGRGRGRGRQSRGERSDRGGAFNRGRPHRDSRSPMTQHCTGNPTPTRRGTDSYKPSARTRDYSISRHRRSSTVSRSRSPSRSLSRSLSRSPSPPRRSRRSPSPFRKSRRSPSPYRRSRRSPSPYRRSRSPDRRSRRAPRYRSRSPRLSSRTRHRDSYRQRSHSPRKDRKRPSRRDSSPSHERDRSSSSSINRSVSPISERRKKSRSRRSYSSEDESSDSRADVRKKQRDRLSRSESSSVSSKRRSTQSPG
ncbi:hypothetical protein BDV95DRAFT_563798 [Massariosphaeria phaeospora]|uniref:PWI domain-containing protein n=1 Tax=Massariosphaeria phaeospora TaxID=100035 RepID=A0A7C8MTY5_9PLEO|nr:hypothetical protein BDV95DRAFT_563798 [Massariosphaeria phaeospora]